MYMHLLHVYGVYKGGTSDLRKKGGFKARIQRGGPDPPPPPPAPSLELSKYTSQRTTFQDFRLYQGGNFVCLFQNFPAPIARLLSHLTRMKVHTCTMIRHYCHFLTFYFHVMFSLFIENEKLENDTTIQRFCRLTWKLSFIYFLHLCRTTFFL